MAGTVTKSGLMSPPAVSALYDSRLRTLACWSAGRLLEDRQTALLVDLVDQVGGVVGLHAREQARGLGVGAALEELELVGRVELLEDVGLELAVQAHGLDDLLALLVAGLLDEVGDLGGVQLGQLAVRDAQARGGHVADEGLDRGEVDDGLGLDALTHARTQQAAQQRASPGVDADDLPLAVDLGDLDLVRGDEATAHQVDQVAREQVLGEEELAGAPLEPAQVHAAALEGHLALAQAADLADRHEEVPALDADDRADDGRVGVVAEARDQVLDATDPVTARS